MTSCIRITSSLLVIFQLYLLTIDKSNATPLPKPIPNPKALPDPAPDPQGQFQYPGSRQEFSMYKQLSQQYPINVYQQQQPVQIPVQFPPGVRQRQDANGNPLSPIFSYSYNITHPSRSGIVLDQNQIQYLTQQPLEQQQQALADIQAQQNLQNPSYAPVIIADPNVIRAQQQQFRQQQLQRPQPILLQGQPQPQNIFQNYSGDVQFFLPTNDPREREPETDDISFRLFPRKKNNQSPGSIIFDQDRQNQPYLRNQQLEYASAIQFNQDNGLGPTTGRPPIQVPYITTPSTLQIIQQQKNSQISVSGTFRSQLGLVNPASLQATSLANLNRNAALNLSPAVRAARVQNIERGRTPAGTQLLQPGQNNPFQSGIQNPYAIQRTQNPFNQNQNQFNSGNYNLLGGIGITPENQRELGEYLFNDPNNPNNINTNTNPLIASSAQKLFILPPDDGSSTIENPNDPAELVVTVVDENSGGENIQGERGRVVTSFSLFIVPSNYKKCVKGYRKSHDGKCRLVIKLRSRNRG